MTGSRTIAYVHEPDGDYLGTLDDDTYKVPGKNVTVSNVSLDNALQRIRLPDDPQAAETIAGTFQGAFEVSWTLTTPWFHDHLFGGTPSKDGSSSPYTYTWAFPTDDSWQMRSSRWYLGVDTASGSVERALHGVVFGRVTASCSVGETVRVTATGFYGDEAHNTAITPGTISGRDAEAMTFDGGALEIPDSTAIGKIQDATLTIDSGARPERTWQRKPVGAVLGGVRTTLDATKIIEDGTQLQLAYGGGSSPSATVPGEAGGSLTFTTSGTSELEYQLTGVTPSSYGWQNLADTDSDVLEDVTYAVDGVEAVAKSDQDSAQ